VTHSSTDAPDPLPPAVTGGGSGGRASDDGTPDPWHNLARVLPPHSDRFAELVAALRRVQDLVTGSNPPDDVVDTTIARLDDIASALEPWTVTEGEAPAGKLDTEPGRGQPVLLPFVRDEETPDSVRGRVRFTRFYLGGGGAAHGGTVPLLFDEVLGRLANSESRPRARTAYLHVNYRHITPIDTDLVVEARIEREEGRKRWVTGRLLHGETVVSDAEGLWVTLRPGQP